jgi:hypothetical protein
MVQQGRLVVEGKGTPQDPHRYSLPDIGPPENNVLMRGPNGSGAEKSASEAKTPPSGPFGPRLLLWDQGGRTTGSCENGVMSPSFGGEPVRPPHQTYNSAGSPGNGLDPLNPDPIDDDPQAPGPPENGPLRERGGPPGHLDPEAARLCRDCWERGVIRMGYIIGPDGRRRCGECLLLLSTSEAKLRNPIC